MVALARTQQNTFASPTPLAKSNEWYTPARYIEAARAVMSSIDLDPASCALANQTVKAKRYYTERENGLAQEWYGNVWLNCPFYGYQANHRVNPMGTWSKYLIEQYSLSNVKQAIMFVLGGTYCKWYAPLWAFPICFTDHKVRFHRPGQSDEHLRDTTTFIYLGPNEQRFIDIFSQFGTIAKRVSPAPRSSLHIVPTLWESEVI